MSSGIRVTGKDEVTSTLGWRLQFVGNSPATWRLIYVEGDNALVMSVEGRVGGSRGAIWCVYFSTITEWSAKAGVAPITEKDRVRVTGNIYAAMHALKHVCKIE